MDVRARGQPEITPTGKAEGDLRPARLIVEPVGLLLGHGQMLLCEVAWDGTSREVKTAPWYSRKNTRRRYIITELCGQTTFRQVYFLRQAPEEASPMGRCSASS
ncbi:hypothetical protein MTCOM_25470 [Moorella thermoacetica]